MRDLAPGGGTLDVAPDSVCHAASTIKLAAMIEVVRRSELGALPLARPVLLVNRFASVAPGAPPYALAPADDSDSSAYALVDTRVPVAELVRRMIVRSSNPATNALLALVPPASVTATARALGAARVEVRRGVEDNAAFRAGLVNTAAAPDLAALLAAVKRGTAASAAGCAWMRDVLLAQEVAAEIPAGVSAGVRVAHKTGCITGVLHDAALVYPPGRAPYALVVLTRGVPDQALARGDRGRVAGGVGGGAPLRPRPRPSARNPAHANARRRPHLGRGERMRGVGLEPTHCRLKGGCSTS